MGPDQPMTDFVYDGRGGRCNICVPAVHFTSEENAISHIMGQKHQSNLPSYGNIRVLGPDYIKNKAYQTPHFTTLPGQYHQTSRSNSIHPVGKQRYQSISRKTPWIYCDLCGNASNSPEQATIHAMGKKHRKRMETKYGKEHVPSTANPSAMRPVEHCRSETGNQHIEDTWRSDDKAIVKWEQQIGCDDGMSSVANRLMRLNVTPVEKTKLFPTYQVLNVPATASDQGIIEEHLKHTLHHSTTVLHHQFFEHHPVSRSHYQQYNTGYHHQLYHTGYPQNRDGKILHPPIDLDSFLKSR